MASGVGHFDSLGNACIKFHLCGVIHKEPGLEFEGIIDTGFTGFIQLPLQHAFSLKLPLEGTASYTLADGTQTACLIALAKTTFAGKMVIGAVTLAAGSRDILVGMGFLRQFKFGMIMVKNRIVMIDEEELEKIGQKQQAEEQAATDAQSPPTPTIL
jgi:predicted aspartyl protease